MDKEGFYIKEQGYQEDLKRLKADIDKEIAQRFGKKQSQQSINEAEATTLNQKYPPPRSPEELKKQTRATAAANQQKTESLETQISAEREKLLKARQQRLEEEIFGEVGKREQFLKMFQTENTKPVSEEFNDARKLEEYRQRMAKRREEKTKGKSLIQNFDQVKPDKSLPQQSTPISTDLTPEEQRAAKLAAFRKNMKQRQQEKDKDRGDDISR